MLRIVTATLAAALLLPAAAQAKKPTKIFLYHVTAVEATGELTRTSTRDGINATGSVTVRNRGLPRKGWRGRRNTAFWGTDGWGRLVAPLGDERWTIQGAGSEGTCGGTKTMKGRKAMGAFEKRGRRYVLELTLPGAPSEESCEIDESFLAGGTDGPEPATIRIDPRKMRGRTVTIPFEHRLHRRFDKQPEDEYDSSWTEEMTVTWKGTLTLERGHRCTVPPDYPCHTMLL